MKVPIPFAITPSNRSYSRDKDSLLLNCFIERMGETPTIIKRPGFNLAKDIGLGVVTGLRGVIYCSAHSKYYMCIKDALYSISSDFATITAIIASGAGTIDTTTGKVYFDQINDGGAAVVMLAIPKTSSIASQAFKITNGTPSVAAEITDLDFPTANVGAGVTFNNYYYVLKEDTTASVRRIYNSDLTAPSTWNALSYISAQEYPDGGVTLAKYNNQLVCFKEYTIEFFYDAGNATGSPLSKITNATLNIGCASAESVVVADNNMLWLSRDPNSGLSIHMLSKGQLVKVSTAYIDRILASVEAIIQEHSTTAFFLTYEGHRFYGISVEGTSAGGTAIPDLAIPDQAIPDNGVTTSQLKRTLIYDLTENLWHEWSSNDTSDVQVVFFCSVILSGASSSVNDYTNTLAFHKTTGNIYSMSPEPIGSLAAVTYKDGAEFIRCEIVTNKFSGGTQDKKRCNSFELLGDRTTTTSNIDVYYSDDDYTNWTGPRTVDMSKRARFWTLGSFEERAFKLIHENDSPMRLNLIELDIEKGST